MEKLTIDPIDFLGRVGIYKEGNEFKKVQVVGIRQPDLTYLFFQLHKVGTVMAEWESGITFSEIESETLDNAQDFDFDFGGMVDMMTITPDYISMMYIGALDFSTTTVEKFGRQEIDFWK